MNARGLNDLGGGGEGLFIFSTCKLFRELGSNLIVLGIKEALPKSKKQKLKYLTVKVKP